MNEAATEYVWDPLVRLFHWLLVANNREVVNATRITRGLESQPARRVRTHDVACDPATIDKRLLPGRNTVAVENGTAQRFFQPRSLHQRQTIRKQLTPQ